MKGTTLFEQERGFSRRDFLVALGLMSVSGKLLLDVGNNLYSENLINRIYNELPDHIHMSKTKIESEDSEPFELKGYGIVYKDKYLTPAHIVDIKGMPVATPFGTFMIPFKNKKKKTTLYRKQLEEIFLDNDNDVAIFQLPKDLTLKTFPCEPSDDINLGDEVYLIGNPRLTGTNIRKGYVSDLNGINHGSHKAAKKGCFGFTPIPGPGDSGSPIVSKNFKLYGICNFQVGGVVGYAKRINEFMKHIQ